MRLFFFFDGCIPIHLGVSTFFICPLEDEAGSGMLLFLPMNRQRLQDGK